MDDPEPGPLADGAYPAVCRATVEALSVVSVQDRALAALADTRSMVRATRGDERDHRRLVALADDAQRPVAPVEAEILDVGGTGLADPESVEAQEGTARAAWSWS
jgi:hypothetical protein